MANKTAKFQSQQLTHSWQLYTSMLVVLVTFYMSASGLMKTADIKKYSVDSSWHSNLSLSLSLCYEWSSIQDEALGLLVIASSIKVNKNSLSLWAGWVFYKRFSSTCFTVFHCVPNSTDLVQIGLFYKRLYPLTHRLIRRLCKTLPRFESQNHASFSPI